MRSWRFLCLLFLEREGKVGYRHGQNGVELETMDYLEFIARVTSHILDKGQVMVRYYGLYANAHLCLRAGGPDSGRGERGLRIEGDAKEGDCPGSGGFSAVLTDNPPAGVRARWVLSSALVQIHR